MNNDYLASLVLPLKNLWRTELESGIHLKESREAFLPFDSDELVAIIPVSGSLEGLFVYGFSKEASHYIIRRLIGPEADPFSQMALSSIGEFANIVTNNAIAALSKKGLICKPATPIVVSPRGGSLVLDIAPHVVGRFASPIGDMHVCVGLTEQPGVHSSAA